MAHQGQVLVEELVLQGLGAGGNDHLAARGQGRHQIGKGLAGAGAGFGDEHRLFPDGRGDARRHLHLLATHMKTGNGGGQRAFGRKSRSQGIHVEHLQEVGRMLADQTCGTGRLSVFILLPAVALR